MSQNRTGQTTIKSVSVSKEIDEILTKYNVSPTDMFRVGVGVFLCEQGVQEYQSNLNIERLRKAKRIIDNLRADSSVYMNKLKDIKKAIELLEASLKDDTL